MPELPELQGLSERLADALVGLRLSRWESYSPAGLHSVEPGPDDLLGATVRAVARRGKFVVMTFDGGYRIVVHLGQAGRVDLERPPRQTRPRGSMVRLTFDATTAVFVREHGTERRARWWVLAPGSDGPLADLGPDVTDDAFEALILHGSSSRRLHTLLRDQHVAAGIGRGYADDILNLAGLSPFASLDSLDPSHRSDLLEAVRAVIASALVAERGRTGALSAARLGERFAVHGRAGEPCPRCGGALARVSYTSHEVVYCPHCQTGGRVLADRRLSRLLR